jgi:hypothetical protein
MGGGEWTVSFMTFHSQPLTAHHLSFLFLLLHTALTVEPCGRKGEGNEKAER